eukprot:XP_001699401.1 vacuolar assembly protein [Chlamydomonas reinhardtii]
MAEEHSTCCAVEPQLKYDILGGDTSSIISKERITCMTLSEKILALGTEQGRIHVLDYSGNQVQVRQLNVHKTRVNDISFDKDGEHVTNLYTEQVTRHEFRTPVKANQSTIYIRRPSPVSLSQSRVWARPNATRRAATCRTQAVALDPRPPASASSARSSWRDLVTGSVGGEGWLGRVDTPLAAAASRDAAAGGVLALRWSGALVAWAFDSAIYDTQSSQLVRTLRRHETRPPGAAAPPPPPSPPGAAVRPAPAGTAAAAAAGAAAAGAASSLNDLRRCSLLFAPDSHLYVSWSDVILVGGQKHMYGVSLGCTAVLMARDAVHLPGADRLAPRQYLGLLPSLPQHLQQQQQPAVAGPAVAGSAVAGAGAPGPAVAAAAAAGGTPFGGRSGAAAAGTAAAGGATTPRRASGTGGGGGSGAGSGAATPRASVASSVGSVSPAPGGGLGQPAAPRRLVPIWIDGQELMLFVAAPTVATARSRDAADRVSWLLERRRWEEALGVVEQAAPGALPPGTYDKCVIDGYIEELMTGQAYDTAVQLAGRLLGGQAQRWERFVYLFAQVRQLPKLVPYIPTDHPRLRTAVYDMALQSLLPSPADHPTLLAVAKSWPPGAFSMAALADAVAARLRRLQQQQQGRPDLALSIYLRLRSPGVFAFVTSHGLQANLLGRAADLFEVDERAALGLLTAHADALPPGNVVPSLQAALSICEARGLVSEQVFVLGRMGNADQALRLIIDRLGDIPRAIDFVVGQRDEELWGRLIDWALGSPDTTGQLLDCIGGYVDPLLLVRRIPRGMEVARLRDRLRAIIADYRQHPDQPARGLQRHPALRLPPPAGAPAGRQPPGAAVRAAAAAAAGRRRGVTWCTAAACSPCRRPRCPGRRAWAQGAGRAETQPPPPPPTCRAAPPAAAARALT